VLAACSAGVLETGLDGQPPTDPTAFEGPAPARRGEPVQTDKLEYEGRRIGPPASGFEFTIVADYRNPTSDTLFIENCGPGSTRPIYQIIPSSGIESVESAFDPAWACVGHDEQLALAPGAVRVDTFMISGPTGFSAITLEPHGFFEGWWRLTYFVGTERGDGSPLAEQSVGLSNVFEIRVER